MSTPDPRAALPIYEVEVVETIRHVFRVPAKDEKAARETGYSIARKLHADRLSNPVTPVNGSAGIIHDGFSVGRTYMDCGPYTTTVETVRTLDERSH